MAAYLVCSKCHALLRLSRNRRMYRCRRCGEWSVRPNRNMPRRRRHAGEAR